jgi:hypothetical protein
VFRKLMLGLVAAGAVASFAATPATANAMPKLGGSHTWYNLQDNNFAWYQAGIDTFIDSTSHKTSLTFNGNCDSVTGKFCQYGLPAGDCMTWDSLPQKTGAQPCQYPPIERQQWWIQQNGTDHFVFVNLYAVQVACSNGYTPLWSAALGAGNALTMDCGTIIQNYDLWHQG